MELSRFLVLGTLFSASIVGTPAQWAISVNKNLAAERHVRTGPSLTEARTSDIIPTRRDHLDHAAAREPMIAEHPDGTLFVSGYGAPDETPAQTVPRLWKSVDHGTTWELVDVGTEASGASGNSDVSLAIAPDGTLYFVTMFFDHKTFEGTQITVGVSPDTGKTWHWTLLSKKRFDDRPWIAVAPDGAAHVIWNDGGGVYHAVSRDRGASWTSPKRIHTAGGSSHLAIGPKGEIAVRIVPISASGNKYDEGVDVITISSDGGSTWRERQVPGQRDWAPTGVGGAIPRWVEPLAWDATGALYLLWTDMKGVRLAQSTDRGIHWHTWTLAETDTLSYYPYLAAREPGELAATWFSGAAANLRWQASRIRITDHGEPHVNRSPLMLTDSWSTDDAHGNAPVRDTAGEYLATLFLRDGTIAVVTPIQNSAAKRFGFSFWTVPR